MICKSQSHFSRRNNPVLKVFAIVILQILNHLAFGSVEDFMERRKKLMDIEKAMHFSYDLEATLTDEERLADQILASLKKTTGFKHDNYNIVLHDYFENFV